MAAMKRAGMRLLKDTHTWLSKVYVRADVEQTALVALDKKRIKDLETQLGRARSEVTSLKKQLQSARGPLGKAHDKG